MEGKFHLPDYTLSKLKCDLCRGYLSVPPISSHRDKNACGRCNPEWERNLIYEQLAKYMVFPCNYCDTGFPWGMIQNHEIKCKENRMMCPPKQTNLYKISERFKFQQGELHRECYSKRIRCPFELCMTHFETQNIVEHFNKFHKDYIFMNSVEANKLFKAEKIWNFNSDTQVCLIMYNTIPFLLFVHNDCKYNETSGDILFYNYYFSLFTLCLEGCEDIKYCAKLEFTSTDDIPSTIKKKNQNIQIFNDKIHCVSFLRRDLFKLNSFDFMTTKFPHIGRTDNLVLSYYINIFDDSIPIIPDKYKESNIYDLFSIEKNFECPICKEYMSPPIYNCSTGHSICRHCREKLTMCPYCQAIIGNSRNFVLEDILDTLLLHCHNEFKGCVYTGRVQDIKLHEVMCSYN